MAKSASKKKSASPDNSIVTTLAEILTARAKGTGTLASADILDCIEDSNITIEQIELLYDLLESKGIEITDFTEEEAFLDEVLSTEQTDESSESFEESNEDEGEDVMKKIMIVEGMSCKHCQAAVEKALSAVEGVTEAKVDLDKKTATISMNTEVADELLMKAVADADFEPVSISVKKGLFGR